MAKSTWWNITHGMREALDKGYKSKSKRQRNKREVNDIWQHGDDFCHKTEDELVNGGYKMGDYRHFLLKDKKKTRDISVLPFRDRVVQNGIKNAIEPLLLRMMTDDMMGGLPERGILVHSSRRGVVRRMRRLFNDHTLTHYIQGDIRKFYDNVDKVVAIRMIERVVKDRRTLKYIRMHLFKQKKLAIGDPFSHLIANLVMSVIIRSLKKLFPKIKIVNFADDVFIFGHSKKELVPIRKAMSKLARASRLHYKRLYIRPIDTKELITYCGYKYGRGVVKLTRATKKRYVKARHKKRSMGAYNGLLELADTKRLRYLIETLDNKHMTDKIRRPFAGKPKKVEQLEGIKHTIVDKTEKKSRQQHSATYWHVQAIAEGLGLIVYSTSSPKIADYLASHDLPMRDMVIAHDWSGYYYDGTVYTDEEEEEMELSPKKRTILIFTIITSLVLMILISFLIALNIKPIEPNPEKINSIRAVYSEDDRVEVKLFNDKYIDSISSIKADGVLLEKVTNTFLFNLSGTHKVELIFKKELNSTAQMFEYCPRLSEVDLSNFESKSLISMEEMFFGCEALTTINFKNFNTHNVVNMKGLFYECTILNLLDVRCFDTSNVEDMSKMFYKCEGLTEIVINNFKTSKVKYMNDMFYDCYSLTSINLTNFDTSNVVNMKGMFDLCSNLNNPIITSFDTSKVTDMSYMFGGDFLLNSIDLSNFNTLQLNQMINMFYNCESLTSLNLSSFDTSKVEYMGELFGRAINLTIIDIRNFNTSLLKDGNKMFNDINSTLNGTIYYNSNKFDTNLFDREILENWTLIDLGKNK